jgi:arsenic resistance protein ArsH
MRQVEKLQVDPAYSFRSLAISAKEDDPIIREKYRPFLLDPEITANDWIGKLELSTVTRFAEQDLKATDSRLKVLVLYGSLRQRYVISRIKCIEILSELM